MPLTSSATPRAFTLSDFDFELPPALIAQHPAAVRSGSRLLDGSSPTVVDRIFHALPSLLQPGDLLSLGSFSKLLPPQPGLSVTATYEGLPGNPSVSVRFR